MDPLQKQVKDLSTKVDALYQVVEQLSQGIAEMLPNPRLLPESNSPQLRAGTGYYQYQRRNGPSDSSMEHKDVLADENNLD